MQHFQFRFLKNSLCVAIATNITLPSSTTCMAHASGSVSVAKLPAMMGWTSVSTQYAYMYSYYVAMNACRQTE